METPPGWVTSGATGKPVVIIGAGLAGLACARRLKEANVPVLVFEAQDQVGGRIRTDRVDGFLLDCGFQVFLTAYPEAERVLDYEALALRPFYPGALVQLGGRRHRFADPWRRPLASLTGLLAPVASLSDALRIARLRAEALRPGDPDSAAAAHRWRHAVPSQPLQVGALWDVESRLAVCGDWCQGARIEGSFLSGRAAAERVLRASGAAADTA